MTRSKHIRGDTSRTKRLDNLFFRKRDIRDTVLEIRYNVTWVRTLFEKEVIPFFFATRNSLHERLASLTSRLLHLQVFHSSQETKKQRYVNKGLCVWFFSIFSKKGRLCVDRKEQNYWKYENCRRRREATTLIEFWFLHRIIPSMTHS